MPIIETTLIAGYPLAVKERLSRALTRAVCSIVAADKEAVIVVHREVEPGSWARGGVTRKPGPSLPDPPEVVAAFAAADPRFAGRRYDRYDEAWADEHVTVFAAGRDADGAEVLDAYRLVQGQVAEVRSWRG